MQAPAQTPDVTRMRKDLTGPLRPPVWPPGLRLAPFDPTRHAAQAHRVMVESYQHGGGEVAAFDLWWDALRGDAEYDPALFFVTLDQSDRLAGLAQCWSVPFVKDLVVDSAYRRLGLGEALLWHVFAVFRAREAQFIDLKVRHDNPSGAERLYLRVGMQPVPLI